MKTRLLLLLAAIPSGLVFLAWLGVAPGPLLSWSGGQWVTQKLVTSTAILGLVVAFWMVGRSHLLAGMVSIFSLTVAAMPPLRTGPESPGAVMSVAANVPSLATVISVFCLCFTVVSRAADNLSVESVRIIPGALSVSALMGYCFDIPVLYFWIPGVSTAMALPTAVSLLALSLLPGDSNVQ